MALTVGSPMPMLDGATEWINEDGSAAHLCSRPSLVCFWAISCPSCHANMPHLQTLRNQYSPKGLQTIVIHMPRGESDLDTEKVRQSVKELGITEPCAIDNKHIIGDLFGINAWPTYFLFDAEGKLRRQAKGNFGVRMIEQALIRLFDEAPQEEQPDHENTQNVGVHSD